MDGVLYVIYNAVWLPSHSDVRTIKSLFHPWKKRQMQKYQYFSLANLFSPSSVHSVQIVYSLEKTIRPCWVMVNNIGSCTELYWNRVHEKYRLHITIETLISKREYWHITMETYRVHIFAPTASKASTFISALLCSSFPILLNRREKSLL